MNYGPEAQSFAERLGAHLKRLRKAAGFTQAQAAERLGAGVAVETVSRFERGAVVPSLSWIEQLAALYKVSVDEVYAGALRTRPESDPARRALHDLVARVPPDGVEFIRSVVDAFLRHAGN